MTRIAPAASVAYAAVVTFAFSDGTTETDRYVDLAAAERNLTYYPTYAGIAARAELAADPVCVHGKTAGGCTAAATRPAMRSEARLGQSPFTTVNVAVCVHHPDADA